MAAIITLNDLEKVRVGARTYRFRYGKQKGVYLRINNAVCRMGLEEDTHRMVLRFKDAHKLTALAERYNDVRSPLTSDGELVLYVTDDRGVYGVDGEPIRSLRDAGMYNTFRCSVLVRLIELHEGQDATMYIRKTLHQLRLKSSLK